MTRRAAGRFDGPLAHVRYVTKSCSSAEHDRCRGGQGRRVGELPCSCSCHLDLLMVALAYRSTRCQLGEHAECPGPRGQLLAEVPGRRDHVVVACTCSCHGDNADNDHYDKGAGQ